MQGAGFALADHLRGHARRVAGDHRGRVRRRLSRRCRSRRRRPRRRRGPARPGPPPGAGSSRRCASGARRGAAPARLSASARTCSISRPRSSRRRLDPLDRLGQQLHRRPQPLELGAALLAAGQVAFQLRRLARLQRAQQVGGDLVAPAVVSVLAHVSPSASSPRIFSRPSRILPFTVPSGTPSMPAISEWLKPPK